MRLVYISNPNSIHTRRWVGYYAEQGHEVHLMSNEMPRNPLPAGVTLHTMAAPARVSIIRHLVLGRAARRLLRQIRPDVLHAHTVSPGGWLGALSGYHPLVVTAWGSDLLLAARRHRRYSILARWVLGRADYVTCVSEDLARAARSLGADPERLEVVPWGVDTQVFHPGFSGQESGEPALRGRLGLAPGPVVLSLRPLRSIYSPLDVAQAIPLVLKSVPEAQFLIRTYACDPELLAQFRSIVQEVATSVYYLGDLPGDEAIAELDRLAAIAVSVPASDGTPMSVLEALACGAALVVSDLPSLREWLQDGQQALLVPVGDVAAISVAIVRLLTDETLRQKLSQNGIALVHQRADSQVWMKHHLDIYQRLVNQAKPPVH